MWEIARNDYPPLLWSVPGCRESNRLTTLKTVSDESLRYARTAMCVKNNPLNCWKFPKPLALQRRDETLKRECGESRKKLMDGIWLNPKCCYNGKSAAKPRTEEGSTTILRRSRVTSRSGGRPKWMKIWSALIWKYELTQGNVPQSR